MRLTIFDEAGLMPTDSAEYDLLREAAWLGAQVEGMGCEIGVRRGGGSRMIMEEFVRSNKLKTHVMVDPWGDIPYMTTENNHVVLPTDYTNEMRAQFLTELGVWSQGKNVNGIVFMLQDTEFFKRFPDYVPTYVDKQIIQETHYCMVHLDGPHSSEPVNIEVDFFAPRMRSGAMMVCDDTNLYDHWGISDPHILKSGFELYKTGQRKAVYRRK